MTRCKCKTTDICYDNEPVLKAHFPYIRLTMEGELVIPMDKVEDFVRRYSEMTDTEAHLEQLEKYRNGGLRKTVQEGDE